MAAPSYEAASAEQPVESFDALLESVPDGVVIVTSAGVIERVNVQIEETFGYSRDELVGHPVEVLIPERLRTGHVTSRTAYALAPRVRAMGTGPALVGRRRDGSELPVDVSIGPLGAPSDGRIIAVVRDTTARRDTERRLAQLGAIVESSDDAIFGIDDTGSVSSWNRAAERLLGFPATSMIGEPVQVLLPPHRQPAWTVVHGHVRAGERVEHMELELRRKDGVDVPVSLTVSPIRDPNGEVVGVSAIARDITEQRLALTTLAEAAARLEQGEALAHVGGWAWDAASGAVQWSDELHRIAGLEPSAFDATLEAWLALIDPDDRARAEVLFTPAGSGDEPLVDELRFVRPDGSRRWVQLHAAPVRGDDGAPIGLRGVCQDVTERREAEDAMRNAYERERAAADELRHADQLKDEFLATVSHELRTPLTAIIGFGNLLAADPGATQDYVRPITRNAQEMHGMIERLLDFARLEAGRVHYAPAATDLRTALEACVASAREVVVDHEIVVDVPDGLRVDVDLNALQRIAGNLITNADKFGPAGTPIEVAAALEDDRTVVVSVSDHGPGLAPEVRDRVFERFFQAPDQPVGKRGTGIGLSIVRLYVELAGGRVWCEEATGGGARFRFTLPLESGRGDGAR